MSFPLMPLPYACPSLGGQHHQGGSVTTLPDAAPPPASSQARSPPAQHSAALGLCPGCSMGRDLRPFPKETQVPPPASRRANRSPERVRPARERACEPGIESPRVSLNCNCHDTSGRYQRLGYPNPACKSSRSPGPQRAGAFLSMRWASRSSSGGLYVPLGGGLCGRNCP